MPEVVQNAISITITYEYRLVRKVNCVVTENPAVTASKKIDDSH
jgi:hypothetical protein